MSTILVRGIPHVCGRSPPNSSALARRFFRAAEVEGQVPRLLALFEEAGAEGAGGLALLAWTPGFGNGRVHVVRLAPAVHTHVTGALGKLAGST